MKNINYSLAHDMVRMLTGKKREQLKNQLLRNFQLTSTYALSDVTLVIYKEGYEMILNGCRASFSCFFYDNDGTLTLATRKPKADKLSWLYNDGFKVSEDFYDCIN